MAFRWIIGVVLTLGSMAPAGSVDPPPRRTVVTIHGPLRDDSRSSR